MAKFISLPLYSDYFYSYNVSLEGVSYNIKFKYNTRSQQWSFDLYSRDNTPVILGIVLVPNYPIMFDYEIDNLTGYFWLTEIPSISDNKIEQYPEALNKYYRLYYTYEE
tara:strand:+ start:36674 stop:37000 length:327 start_codon:yes stop_codon:yes gene_type:complete